ncbi:MAG: response regulator, partial [Oscillospiraceae bacterium]|nr:response regulator [Oscillospiraceae bacterium]
MTSYLLLCRISLHQIGYARTQHAFNYVALHRSALLEYLNKRQVQSGLYFLDVDLQSDLNGIELGAEIREIDVSATIVFITSHANLLPQVFRYKVEAMEYIVKDSPAEEIEKRVIECMQLAYQRYLGGKHTQVKYFTAKIGDQMLNIPFDDILFFESSTE